MLYIARHCSNDLHQYNVELSQDVHEFLVLVIEKLHSALKMLVDSEDEEPGEPDDEEEQLPDIDLPHLIACLMHYIAKPVVEVQEVTEFCHVSALNCDRPETDVR